MAALTLNEKFVEQWVQNQRLHFRTRFQEALARICSYVLPVPEGEGIIQVGNFRLEYIPATYTTEESYATHVPEMIAIVWVCPVCGDEISMGEAHESGKFASIIARKSSVRNYCINYRCPSRNDGKTPSTIDDPEYAEVPF